MGGGAFCLSNQLLTWTLANEFCQSIGGTIITIKSQDRNDEISAIIDQVGIELYFVRKLEI